jgi:hypothetical protein
MPSLRTSILIGCAGVILPFAASAVVVPPGYDLLQTIAGPTHQDFGPTPIPQDFFNPSSDPFDRDVPLQGFPFGMLPICGTTLIGFTDTVIERKAAMSLPNIGDTDVVPIEIVALSLTSVNPITVTYNGGQNPELWRLELYRSQLGPSPGTMTVAKTHGNGGTFTAQFQVRALLVFTRVSDNLQRTLDGMIINDYVCPSTPWAHDPYPNVCPPCGTTNFFPGIDPAGNVFPFIAQAPNAAQGLASPCSGPVGVHAATWGVVKALYRD